MGIVENASKYIGIHEGTTSHHAIIDYYNNNIRPLPRGYRVKYSDSWCAIFVSVIMKMSGCVNAPYECSVAKMWQKAVQHGQRVTNPAVGDIVVYDWKNNGTLDHVGIVSSVGKSQISVIEGNFNDSVGVRKISKSSKEIEGFFRVPTATAVNNVHTGTNLTNVARDVIRGKYGNGSARKVNLQRAGYNYAEVQLLVNKLLRG